ncbi:hypothetical protein D3C76_1658890 [compost metagenome]
MGRDREIKLPILGCVQLQGKAAVVLDDHSANGLVNFGRVELAGQKFAVDSQPDLNLITLCRLKVDIRGIELCRLAHQVFNSLCRAGL